MDGAEGGRGGDAAAAAAVDEDEDDGRIGLVQLYTYTVRSGGS